MRGHALPTEAPDSTVERVTEVFRALSEPTRLRLVLSLAHEEHNVSELMAQRKLPQSTVSRHLAVLRAARLVEGERHGTSVVYRLAGSHLRDLLLEAFAHEEHERNDAATRHAASADAAAARS